MIIRIQYQRHVPDKLYDHEDQHRYSIQQESQRKTIEVTRANADIARREKEAELAEKEIAIRERKLDAEVRKAADAKKYQAEREAEADLIRRQRDADARKYEALQEAEAKKAAA